MKKLTLGDVCKKESSNIAQKDIMECEGEYPIYGAGGFIKNVNFYQQELPYIAVVKDGAGIGRTMLLPAYSSVIGTMQYILPVDYESIDLQYLYYAIVHMDLGKYFSGATIPHIYFKDYKKEKLFLPEICEQQRISRLLQQVDLMIEKQNNQVELMDKLVQSRFVEMFGDTKINNKRWKTTKLLNILEKGSSVSYGIVQTGDDIEGGVPVFRPIDIAGGHIPKISELKRTDKEISDKYKRTLLKGYELLITVRGSVGETFQTNVEFAGCNVGRNIVPLRFDTDKVLYKYMENYFSQSGTKDILASMTKGIALQGLNMSEFREIAIIIPPIELQKEFVRFAETIDKSKLSVFSLLQKHSYYLVA